MAPWPKSLHRIVCFNQQRFRESRQRAVFRGNRPGVDRVLRPKRQRDNLLLTGMGDGRQCIDHRDTGAGAYQPARGLR